MDLWDRKVIDASGLRIAFNAKGALAGHAFKNKKLARFFYGPGGAIEKATWLPKACRKAFRARANRDSTVVSGTPSSSERRR